jgi:imidazolonepropionase-like amidohydrolase
MWLTGGRIYDVHAGTFHAADLNIERGRIAAVGRAPKGAEAIDLDGLWLLPGFIDCHVHICVNTRVPAGDNVWRDALPGTIAIWAAEAARRMLMAGITTARDVGGWDYHEIAVREAIDAGWIPGPRLYCAGRILSMMSSSAPYYPGMYEQADGPDAVRAAARRQLARGANLIKVMASGAVNSTKYERADAIQYRPDELAAAVEIARDNFTHVAAHAHACSAVRNAVLAGCRSVEHGTYADDATYRLMVEHGTFLVPTYCTAPAFLADPAFAARALPHVRERYEQRIAIKTASLVRARELGVTIAMGTDAGTPGNHCGDNMQEVALMVERCGFAPAHAIRCATVNGAALLGRESDLGALEEGRIADVIAVPRDPLADIGALREVAFVMKEGTVARHDRRA